MIEEIAELVVYLGFDRVVDRDETRTTSQQICLFIGIVFVLLASALAITAGPLYGLAAGIIAVALLRYGV